MGLMGVNWRCPTRVVAVLDMIFSVLKIIVAILRIAVVTGAFSLTGFGTQLLEDVLTLFLVIYIAKILLMIGRLVAAFLLYGATEPRAIAVNRRGCFNRALAWILIACVDFLIDCYDASSTDGESSILFILVELVCFFIGIAYAFQLNSNEVFPEVGIAPYQQQYVTDEYGNQVLVPMDNQGEVNGQPQDGYYGTENEQQGGAVLEPSTADEDEDDAPKDKKKKKKNKKKKGGD